MLRIVKESITNQLTLHLQKLIIFLHEGSGRVRKVDLRPVGPEGQKYVEFWVELVGTVTVGELYAVGDELVDCAEDVFLTDAGGLHGQPENVQVLEG